MKLFIYGAGGAGLETYDLVGRNGKIKNRYADVCFVDDFAPEEAYYSTRRIHFASCGEYMGDDGAEFVIAAGEPSVRKLLYEKVKSAGYPFATLIDGTAIISDTAAVGEGCIIQAHAVVSSGAVIKENCFLMLQTIVGIMRLWKAIAWLPPRQRLVGTAMLAQARFWGWVPP